MSSVPTPTVMRRRGGAVLALVFAARFTQRAELPAFSGSKDLTMNRLQLIPAVFVATALLGCVASDGAPIGSSTAPLLFGQDDRVEATEVTHGGIQRVVAATAGLARDSTLSCGGGTCALSTTPFDTGQTPTGPRPLCSDTAFRGQAKGARCSAFLVGPDLMATAGHCMVNQSDCDTQQVVFGFVADPDGTNEVTTLPEEDVYDCVQLVAQNYTPGSGGDADDDWAVFRVDRVVSGRAPLAIRRGGTPALDTELVGIGHPNGLPLKVAANGFVEVNTGSKRFQTSLDMYGGNSGSPVFDLQTLVVQGIHVSRAASHFVVGIDPVSGASCAADRVCSLTTGCAPGIGVFGPWSKVMRMAGDVDDEFPSEHIPLRPVEIMAVVG